MTVLSCEQETCPLATEGRCLEGFADIETCPHVRSASDADAAHGVTLAEDPASTDAEGGAGDLSEESAPAWVQLGGDAALSLEQADELAAHAPCRVVLVAGEYDSGKTTLVVQLYAQFLHGPFVGAEFGGSRTLRALDKRHHPAREASGLASPETRHTADEDMRLLHLRLRRHARVRDLLLSDVKGEFFESVIDGAAAADEVPVAARADLCLLVVDGRAIGEPLQRQRAVTRARLLIAGLAEPGGLRPGIATVIVLTKFDLVPLPDRPWAEAQVVALRQWAVERGLDATGLCVAARPPAGPPEGLDALLDHVLPLPVHMQVDAAPPRPGDRQYWNQPEGLTWS